MKRTFFAALLVVGWLGLANTASAQYYPYTPYGGGYTTSSYYYSPGVIQAGYYSPWAGSFGSSYYGNSFAYPSYGYRSYYGYRPSFGYSNYYRSNFSPYGWNYGYRSRYRWR